MESLVAQRIKSVLEAKQISISAFSKMIGMQQVTCNRQLRGDQIQNRTKASKVHLLGYFAERLPTSLGGSSQIFYPLHAKLLVYVNHLGRLATELDDMLLHNKINLNAKCTLTYFNFVIICISTVYQVYT